MEWLCKGEHGIWAGCGGKQKQTNADRIRAMTDEEMASILTDDFCELICSSPVACNGDCELKMLEWLKQEIKL